ncbi:hypothetical protein B0A81_15460 [Flavobacterium plurextorum]|uniref:Tox-MPTase3 domain-containing protein n=1 Tax=Flavobacterium plurextorum TaxID=1114867 RepID=A0ABX4CR93_9FLAO|nr:hypothetical protein [Flavobacterium plurextorum]OXB05102.1 hypothetical protein B0A81_15460 [Flavobacterium plurextorum]
MLNKIIKFRIQIVFLLLFFNTTINAQRGENDPPEGFDLGEQLDQVRMDPYEAPDNSWDQASLYWDTEWGNYPSSSDDGSDNYNNNSNNNDSSENNSSGSSSSENNQVQNIIDKPIITSAELVKLIADLAGRYTVTSKYNYVLTTSDGVTHVGTITRLYDSSIGHSLYYFMPYSTDTIFKEGLQYKIPEPGSNSLPANSNATGSVDWQGMPIGFYNIMSNSGNIGGYFSENDNRLEDYCEGCTKIERIDNPKFTKLAGILQRIQSIVLNTPILLKNFMLLTGYNKEQVQFVLWEESLKAKMRVADISNWGLYERFVTPNVFFVRKDLVDSLETGGFKTSGNNLTVNDTSFFIAIIILHELIHYGRHVNNLPQRVGIYEAGQVFETNIFGKVLGSSNVINLWRQYGWYF